MTSYDKLTLAEVLDFITGLFTIDLLGDDVQRYDQDELMRDLHSPSARTRHNAVRVAISGRSVGPPLWESIAVLGRDRTLSRLRATRLRVG